MFKCCMKKAEAKKKAHRLDEDIGEGYETK